MQRGAPALGRDVQNYTLTSGTGMYGATQPAARKDTNSCMYTYVRERDAANEAARHDAVVIRPFLVPGADDDEAVSRPDGDLLLPKGVDVHSLVELVRRPQAAQLNLTTDISGHAPLSDGRHQWARTTLKQTAD